MNLNLNDVCVCVLLSMFIFQTKSKRVISKRVLSHKTDLSERGLSQRLRFMDLV